MLVYSPTEASLVLASLLAVAGFVVAYYVWRSEESIFLSAVLLNIVFAEILILRPNFGLLPFFVLLVLLLLLIMIECRAGYEGHLALQLVRLFVLILTCAYISVFLIIVFGVYFGKMNISVVSVRDFAGTDYYLIVNAINKYKWPASKILWESAQIFIPNSGQFHDINPDHIRGITSLVEKVLKDSLIQWEAKGFSTPYPIKPGSDLYRRILDSYMLFNGKPGGFINDADALNVIKRFNMNHTHTQNIASFLHSKLSVENLYMSLVQKPNLGEFSDLVIGSAKSISPKQFVNVSQYDAHLLQAAITFQATGIISLSDFLGLLKLLSGSIEPSSFAYGAALYFFYGRAKLYFTLALLGFMLFLALEIHGVLYENLPRSMIGVPLKEYFDININDDDDIAK